MTHKSKEKMLDLIKDWETELSECRAALVALGAKPNTIEYALNATDALRLSICISQLRGVISEQ